MNPIAKRTSSRLPHEARTVFRETLLPLTLAHATKNSQFYSTQLGERVSGIKRVEDLAKLPLLFKEDILQNFGRFHCGIQPPALIQHTTGTTGHPLQILRSFAEIAFIRSFFNDVVVDDTTSPAPIILHLADLYHGSPLGIPSRCYTIPAGVTDDILMSNTVRLLKQKHQLTGFEDHISVITGLVPYIKTLTAYLIDSGFDFSAVKIRTIIPLCTIITPRWRKVLKETWNANVVDRYSLSEIFGGGTLCLECSNYHFDPTVVAEVVDPVTLEVIRSGVGVLVLTSLYPFVQQQPMIRYFTGDLVEANASSCQPDTSVRFKGRLANACSVKFGTTQRFLILPVDLYEVLDDFPDIACSERFTDLKDLRDHSSAGSLKFQFCCETDNGRPVLSLKLELKYNANLYPERALSLRNAITSEILHKCSDFRQAFQTQQVSFDVQFVPPGSLLSSPLKV